MSSPKAIVLSCVLAALAAAPCLGGEPPGEYDYDEDMLSRKEQAELELRRRREAQPVLACEPGDLSAKAKQGETATLRLTVLNKGGQTLRWLVQSAPGWLTLDRRSGDLGFEEKRALIITVRRSSAGTVSGNIVFEATGAANSPLTIPVVVDIKLVKKPEPPIGRPTGLKLKPRPPRERGSRGRFGVRAGYMMPGSADERDYEASAVLGLAYRLPRKNGARLSYEVGLDTFGTDASDGVTSSRIYSGRFDVLFPFGAGEAHTRFYLLSGIGVLVVSTDMEAAGESDSASAGALNLGAGLDLGGGRLDARLTHDVLLGSTNITGMTCLALAYNF